jgi:hypothetical protein
MARQNAYEEPKLAAMIIATPQSDAARLRLFFDTGWAAIVPSDLMIFR